MDSWVGKHSHWKGPCDGVQTAEKILRYCVEVFEIETMVESSGSWWFLRLGIFFLSGT